MGTYKEEMARREGMSYAFSIAKEKGLGALEEELKFRNATNIPLKVSRKQVEAFVEETKQTMFDTILLMSCYALRDEFGFGEKRLRAFKKRFSDYSESLAGGYMTWQEIAEQMKNETKIEFHIRSTDKNLKC
ncbi:MAG TPA: hypothetical protein DGR27_05180 [Eubacterium sp.]|nr:MAG TPA: hypothetical protein [Caudoviricetes sp.]HAS70610.1 hypothetical protein [Eubacterium sp.]HCW37893.1 hypothetical protein [Eubacterium sp.]